MWRCKECGVVEELPPIDEYLGDECNKWCDVCHNNEWEEIK